MVTTTIVIVIIVFAFVFPCLHGLDVFHSTNLPTITKKYQEKMSEIILAINCDTRTFTILSLLKYVHDIYIEIYLDNSM